MNNKSVKNEQKLQTISRSPIDLICKALGRYYESIKVPYNGLFSKYCNESYVFSNLYITNIYSYTIHTDGIHDGLVSSELQQPLQDCFFTEFDKNFPFRNELINATDDEKQQFILDLITNCHNNPNIIFDPLMPQCLLSGSTLKYLYQITESEFNSVKKVYQEQCPALWHSGMENDKSFTYITAIGWKYKFDYLQYLVDGYLRERVKNIGQSYKIHDWSLHHPHFKPLRNVSIEQPWKADVENTEKEAAVLAKRSKVNNPNKGENNDPKSAYEIAKHAVASFELFYLFYFDFFDVNG